MTESDLLRAILLAHSTGTRRIFRNNVGVLQDRAGRYVRYGLALGSPDLIGLQRVMIMPEHVGRTFAVFVGIEAKSQRGRLTDEQTSFLDMLGTLHAFHGVARSVEDATRILTLTDTYP